MVGVLKDLANALGLKDNPRILWLIVILGFLVFLYPQIKKLYFYFRDRKLERDLHPFFTFYEIRTYTKYFIKTRFLKNISQEDKHLKKRNKTESLISFFLKKGFRRGKDNNRFYLILADSGMGKTTFMMNLYIHYKKRWVKDYHITLLPLGHPRFDEKLSEIEPTKHGNTILLLDAFDEDQKAVKNYKKRLKEIIKKVQDFREVVITCRTQFFPNEDATDIETSILRGLGGNYKLQPFYISPFTEKEIKQYLRKKFNVFQFQKRKKALEIVKKVPKLMIRPMLLVWVEDLLDAVESYEYVSDIYQTLIDKWIIREAKKKQDDTELYQQQLEKFTQAIAVEIYKKQKKRGLLLSPDEIKWFADQNDIILDLIDLKSRSLLNRNAEGKYKFSHKSILEYLVAQAYAKNPESIRIEDFEGMEMLEFFLKEKIEMYRKELEETYESWEQQLKGLKIGYTTNINELRKKYSRGVLEFFILKDELKLSLTENTTHDYFFLTELSNLQSLSLSNSKIQDYFFLRDLSNLQSLDLRNNQIQDISPLQGLTNLRILDLRSNQIQDTSPLQGLTNLQSLDLRSNQIQDISPLQGLINLRFLYLSSNQAQDISPLQGLINLRFLYLSSNQVQDISPLQGLINLHVLFLRTNQIQDISPLQGLINLQSLDLSRNQIQDVSFLQELIKLQSLDLSRNQIQDVSFLKDLNILISLYLNSNQIQDVSFLQELIKLQSLDLRGNPITQSSRNTLSKILRNCDIYFYS